jgi:hypothetical protein
MFGFLLCAAHLSAGTYYVASNGNDANSGTIDFPFRTIPKGIASATTPGDTIYVRGGTHLDSATITITASGTSTNRFHLFAFPGERPRLDFSSLGFGSSNRGFNLSGNYWYIKGFDIFKAGDNGVRITGSNNIIEFCSFMENSDTGLQLDNGASNNQIINCDSYDNADPNQGNADGFAAKMGVGSGNYFYGCRAWQNSDDGWDGYLRGANNVTTTLVNCWTFMNGYLKNGSVSSGNGNGFKMGGSDGKDLEHNMILENCLAFNNLLKGFDQNSNKGSMTLYNCTAYNNATNYSISQTLDSGKTFMVTNCVALGFNGSLGSFAVQQTNSWMPQFTATNADFLSTDTTGVRGPRNQDGSLPSIAFMHLAPGSDLIDAGADVGLPFKGTAPDLGCFETEAVTSVLPDERHPSRFTLDQNYPNPFNPETVIRFSVETTGKTTLEVFNLVGEHVATLFEGVAESGQFYNARFNGKELASGVYFCRLHSGMRVDLKKLLLLK